MPHIVYSGSIGDWSANVVILCPGERSRFYVRRPGHAWVKNIGKIGFTSWRAHYGVHCLEMGCESIERQPIRQAYTKAFLFCQISLIYIRFIYVVK